MAAPVECCNVGGCGGGGGGRGVGGARGADSGR